MPGRALLLVLATAVALLAAGPAPAAERWRRPVGGDVVRPFSPGAHPYAAGRHRGVDLATRPGTPVRAACGGRVRFAGPVPGRGHVVSVVCARLVATHLGLGPPAVREGEVVAEGTRVGAAAGHHVQLGARRLGRRHGHIDPLGLLAGDPPPLGPAPPARHPRRPAPPDRPANPPAPALPRADPARTRAPAPATTPLAAWLGLALVAGAVPLARRARSRAPRAPVHTPGAAPAPR